MTVAMQRHLIMLFCLRCEGKPLHKYSDEEIAFFLQVTPLELPQIKSSLAKKGFIDQTWEIVNWDKRQYLSDSSTERVRQYRERRKHDETLPKRDETQNVTAPDTDTDTEQIQKQKKPSAKPKAPADQRFGLFKEDFERDFKYMNKVAAPWDAKEASNLSRWLKANPEITQEQWRNILRNRRASPLNKAAPLSHWVGKSLSWLAGQADEWGKEIKPNGGRNAAVSTSKADGDLAVLAESLFGTKHQGAPYQNGNFQTSEDRQTDAGIIHGIFTPVGPAGLPSGDGDDF